MADQTSTTNRFARDSQRRIIGATAIGMNALKPIMHLQVSMLRMWANSIERFAGGPRNCRRRECPWDNAG
jgi:hypothetical protein